MKTNKTEPFSIKGDNGVEIDLIADQVCVTMSVTSSIQNNKMVTSANVKADLYTKLGKTYIGANLQPRTVGVVNLFECKDATLGKYFTQINTLIEQMVLELDDLDKWNKNF